MLHLGVSTFQEPNVPVIVTIIAKSGARPAAATAPVARARQTPEPERPRKPQPAPVEREPDLPSTPEPAPQLEQPPAPEPAAPRQVAPERAPAPQPSRPAPSAKSASPKIKQDTLQFEPVARGRFEKIEPTIVEGEDLDVPTFLRLNVKKP